MSDAHKGDTKSGTPVSKSMGSIHFISEILARRRVARLEKGVGRFRIRTSDALAKLGTECAQTAALQASALAAREAALGLSPEAREPLLRRIEQAESRLDGMKIACQMPRDAVPEIRDRGEPGLSGGGHK